MQEGPIKFDIRDDIVVVVSISGALGPEHLDALKEGVEMGAETIQEAYARTGQKVKILMDLTGFSGDYNVEAVNVLTEFAKRNKDFVDKTAAFSAQANTKLAGEAVAALADRENIKFFSDKETAEAWLLG